MAKQSTDGNRVIAAIDADPFSLDIIELMLSKFTVHKFPDSAGAFAYFQENTADLILLDWALSESGVSLVSKFKNDESTRGIPLVIISGKAEPSAIEKAIEAGAIGYITKPFNKSVLQETIENILK
ncbi:MAG TPA: response regulator [bacterium]|jgi:two-component system phosphate regulon response regulator PhoB